MDIESLYEQYEQPKIMNGQIIHGVNGTYQVIT